ncbi:MAG: serine/threonine protein kinase [Planctomycetes bacterium]|nr:serine/threonine protein kinase [Planctomycetota bacterium]
MDFSESPSSNKEATPKSSTPPERSFPDFEGYQIIEEMPRGGQAFVYKAIHKATKAKVALKVLTPGSLASAKVRRRFEREVDLISGLKHPYIVSIRDSGIAKGHYYFAMEYLQGLMLDQYISFQGLSLQETLELFSKMCDAITHAHQHGVIHRDLKPSNIMVDERGDPHILDFGLAKAAGSLSDTISMVSMTGEIQGTLAYMSPEQASGQTDLIDTRTDVYSLGVILYQLLTGQFPYDISGTTAQILRNIESNEPIRPRNIVSKFNSEVEAIILKCLDKKPSCRYHSAADLQDDIQHWLNGEPLVAKSHSSIYVLYKLAGRHKYTATVVALLFIIFLSFSCLGIYLYNKTRSAQAHTQRTLDDMSELYQEIGEDTIQTAFLNYIEGWQDNNTTQMTMFARAITAVGPSKEAKGIIFLQNVNEWSEKETQFREEFIERNRWFADMVIGESYMHKNLWSQALAAYNRSFIQAQRILGSKVTGDGLLKAFLAVRIQQLKAMPDNTGGKMETIEGKGVGQQ